MRRTTIGCLILSLTTFLPAQEPAPESKGETATPQTPAQRSETPPKISTPQRVRLSQSVSSGLLIKKVNPQYPPKAERGRIQGTVLMHAVISKTGDVESVELVSGHPLLAPAALEAVKQWKYKACLLNGKPVEVDTQIQVNFTLSGN